MTRFIDRVRAAQQRAIEERTSNGYARMPRETLRYIVNDEMTVEQARELALLLIAQWDREGAREDDTDRARAAVPPRGLH